MANKYGAIKTELDGYTFDSRAEARRYLVLKLRQEAGEISGLMVHPMWPLEVNGVKVGRYTGDFLYWDRGLERTVVEDVKSKPTKTRDYRLRRLLMRALFEIEIQEVA